MQFRLIRFVYLRRYFIDDHAIKEHFRTKLHKRRMKALETEPYSHDESLRAAGMGSYIPPKKFVIKTQPDKETVKKIFAENKDKDDMILS
jgi:bud site selection protein 20